MPHFIPRFQHLCSYLVSPSPFYIDMEGKVVWFNVNTMTLGLEIPSDFWYFESWKNIFFNYYDFTLLNSTHEIA